PEYEIAWNNIGNALDKMGMHDKSIKYHEKAIELNPKFDYAYYAKGYALHKLGKSEEGLKFVEISLALNPNYDHAWYALADIYLALGEPDEAFRAIENALTINPEYAEAHYMKAKILKVLGRDAEALASLNEGLRAAESILRFEKDLDTLQIKEKILIELGRYTEAIGVEIEILERGFVAEIGERLAKNLFREGLYRKLVEFFGTRKEMQPSIQLYLAKSYFEIGEIEKAISVCDEVINATNDVNFIVLKVQMLYESGMKEIEKLLFEIPKEHLGAKLLLGNIYFAKKKYAEALACFTAYLKNEENPEIWYKKGVSHLECKQIWEAEFCFDYLIGKYPDSWLGWFGKYLVAKKKGRDKKAQNYLSIAKEHGGEIGVEGVA
ncbi:MAG: tetratricopeptide repeat protein, partial [Thermoplasmata archaeon]